MFDPLAELRQLVGRFEAEGLEYAVCGGLALGLHGVVRATKGIDVLARPAALPRFERIVRDLGFIHSALPMTFDDGMTLRRFTKIVDFKPLMFDLLLIPASAEGLFDARLRLVWGDGHVQVVSREGLIVLKTTAGRLQDLVDVQRLMELERDGR